MLPINRNVILSLVVCPLLLILLCGCAGYSPTETIPSCNRTELLMGTAVTVTAYANSQDAADAAVEAAFQKAYELELLFSPSLPDSELNAVNAAAFGEEIVVSKPFFCLLEQSLHYQKLSDGALDCTMGRLIDLWGIGTEDAHVPTQAEISGCLFQNDSPRIQLHPDTQSVHFLQEHVSLQFGAVAKGYIADEMKDVLQDAGIESGLIVLGGNVQTIGGKPFGENWNVGITDPLSPDTILGTLSISDISVVTSGNYERYFEEDGVRYHHILDPITGFPADSGLISTTILAPDSLTCDALSTATFVLGAEAGMALIESLPDTEAVFITETGEILTSSGIAQYDFTQVKQ